jgi:hypothetical protein
MSGVLRAIDTSCNVFNEVELCTGGGGGGMAIGDPVTGGTAGSVLFVDGAGDLGQDPTNFNYDDSNRLFVMQNMASVTISTSGTGFGPRDIILEVDTAGAFQAGIVSGRFSFTQATTQMGADGLQHITLTLFDPGGGNIRRTQLEAGYMEWGDNAAVSAAPASVGTELFLRNNAGALEVSSSVYGGAWTAVATGVGTMAIGGVVTGGTAGNVLFMTAGPVLAEDNDFSYTAAGGLVAGVTDGNTAALLVTVTARHSTAASSAGIGAGIGFSMADDAAAIINPAAMGYVLTTVTAGATSGRFTWYTTQAGAIAESAYLGTVATGTGMMLLDSTWGYTLATSAAVALHRTSISGTAVLHNATSTIVSHDWQVAGVACASLTSGNLLITHNPASTNTTVDMLTLTRTSSAAPAANIGAGIIVNLENSTPATVLASRQETILTTVTAGSEDSLVNFYTLADGTLSVSATIGGTSAGGRGVYVPASGRFVLGTTASTSLGILVSGNVATYTTNATSCIGHSFTITTAGTSGTRTAFRVTQAAHTGQTLSTEAPAVVFDLSATVTWATGALANQRSFQISAQTIAFAGASTLTDGATLYVSGAPIAGANATITNAYALWSDAGRIRLDGIGIALGGGAAPTLGTIGGSGPATAAQNQWLEITVDGTRYWVPAWV